MPRSLPISLNIRPDDASIRRGRPVVAIDETLHTTEYCLARAVQCEEMAEKTEFAPSKAIFLDMAKRWRASSAESPLPLLRRPFR
jgi:hypothetical protein